MKKAARAASLWPLPILLPMLLGACSLPRIDQAPRVATGLTSELLCGGAFIAGLPPERTYGELVRTMPGMGLADWAITYRVDPAARSVEARVAGGFASRAVYREGLGCVLGGTPEPGPASTSAAAAPDAGSRPEDPWPSDPPEPRLQSAVDAAFDTPAQRTLAIVVLHDGRLAAERYAPGITPDTSLIGFSMTKSVTSAMAGVLARLGRLRVDQPLALAAWQGDERRRITLDQLLRQVSGLDIPQANSGFDLTARIMFTEPDKADACARAPLTAEPGTRWNYTDCHYMLVARALREAAGGSAESFMALARRELFEPAGMRHVAWDFDPAGTPNGAMALHASARDWARFGQLYLDDGVVQGRRVLPEGWVRYSTTPTGDRGYGAGWWLQHEGRIADWGLPWGLPHAPADTYFARGYRGQFTVVVPSARLVVVRLGASDMDYRHIEAVDRLVAEAAALYSREANSSAKR